MEHVFLLIFLWVCWLFVDLAHLEKLLKRLPFLLALKCHRFALICYQPISPMWVCLETHPCFVSFALFEGCPFIEDRFLIVEVLTCNCLYVITSWPHVCCSLSFCIFFFPHLLLVETIQNNPILLMESSPLGAAQHQDSFMETSIPVPVLNWQDVSNKSAGFAECV